MPASRFSGTNPTKMKSYLTILLLILVFSNCDEKKKDNSSIIDSSVDNEQLKLFIQVDSIFRTNDDVYNQQKSGEVFCDIPVTLMGKFLSIDFDTIYDVSTICPLNFYSKNDNFTALFYQINCKAGGDCARFFLTTISTKGEVINNKLVGRNESTMRRDKYFDYSVMDNYSIKVYQEIEEINDDDEVVVDTIYIKLVRISADGKISMGNS